MRRAHPLSSPLRVGQEPGSVEGLVPFEHEVDGPAQLVGQDGQGFALAVLIGHFLQILFPRLI